MVESSSAKQRTSSIKIVRTETIWLTVLHDPTWDKEDIGAAIVASAAYVEDVLPLGSGSVELLVDDVKIGSRTCDDKDWQPLDLDTLEPDDDGDDDDGPTESGDPDNDDDAGNARPRR